MGLGPYPRVGHLVSAACPQLHQDDSRSFHFPAFDINHPEAALAPETEEANPRELVHSGKEDA